MVVTCVAFTRSLPAVGPLRELPIEPAATGHLDPRYLAGGRIRTGRLNEVVVDFRGRPIPLVARALHHRRVDLVDLVVEIEDAEAAAYLAAFENTSGAVAAELFRNGDERRSIAALHGALATDLLGRSLGPGLATPFARVVFHRGLDAPEHSTPGIVTGHHLSVSRDRLEVHADTTVLADERLGYEMVVGLSARSRLLVDAITRDIDALALAAGEEPTDPHALLTEATEVQRRAIVVQREISPHRLLAASLGPVHDLVDATMGLGPGGRGDLDRSTRALRHLIDALLARSVEQRFRTTQRLGLVAVAVLLLLVVLVLVGILRAAG